MENFISLFIGLFLAGVAILIAALIANYVYTAPGNITLDYFQSKYGARLTMLIEDGLSEKEAYEKIVVERDKEGRDRLFWALFWAGMAVLAALFPNLI